MPGMCPLEWESGQREESSLPNFISEKGLYMRCEYKHSIGGRQSRIGDSVGVPASMSLAGSAKSSAEMEVKYESNYGYL